MGEAIRPVALMVLGFGLGVVFGPAGVLLALPLVAALSWWQHSSEGPRR